MPEFPIVDAHVHFWDPEHLRYPWLKDVPQIRRRHDPVDLDRLRGAVEIDTLVFV